jgi:Copper transport outer membrane protein, MctB
MINFRYHVVSLTAVFCALAIGLVVGTAALNGEAADWLNDQVNSLGKDNRQLRETVSNLEEQANSGDDFAIEAAPHLLAGKLTGRRVVVLALPTGRDHADGVATMLDTAGAVITGRVDVRDKFLDPDNNVELLGLADLAAQPTIPTTHLPANVNGVEKSGALLATALLDRPAGAAPVAVADLQASLAVYTSAGFLAAAGKVTSTAEAMVIVSGQPYTDDRSARKNEAVAALATQFHKLGPVAVAGSGTTDGNLVAATRDNPTFSRTVSTVDNANTIQGQVVAALAVARRLTNGAAGHYGIGPGADSRMPKHAD